MDSSSSEDEMLVASLSNSALALARDTYDQNRIVALSLANSALALQVCSEQKRKKRLWIKQWREKKNSKGSFSFLTKELKFQDERSFKNYLRMTDKIFELLLSYVEKDLERQDTVMRNCVSPKEKLALTIRYLATGETYQSMEYQTRLSKSFLSVNIPQICDILWNNLKGKYLKFPATVAEWEKIAENYAMRWQFPHCLGSLDGKHISFRCLRKDGAVYHNYKGTNSIVLLALVDADCKFIYVDIGSNGRANDAGIFAKSDLKMMIDNAEKHFPPDKEIGNNRNLPYVIVTDDAFPLQKHIMKPYPYTTKNKMKQIFNIRLSRARHTVEHAFGILTNRFQILQKPINLKVGNVESISRACCALHNFLMHNENNYSRDIQKTNSQDIPDMKTGPKSNRGMAETVRQQFAEYFVNEGKLDWQEDKI